MADRETVVNGLNDIGGFIAGRIGVEQARNFLRTIDDAIALLNDNEMQLQYREDHIAMYQAEIQRQDEKIKELQSAYDYLQKQFFEVQDKLLKEQEAKAIEYHDNSFTGLPVAHCPNCMRFAGQFYASVEEETHYCPWCGQAVKWE